MRKFRPSHKCIYIIPEIHGNAQSLEVMLDRIIPLRFHINQEDQLVFLGDFIDGDNDSYDVIECLINLKNVYNDSIIFIRGNHETLLLRALNGNDEDLRYWIDKGGSSTLSSYIKKSNLNCSPYAISQNRLNDIIPNTHIDFYKSLKSYAVIDNYLFFHGGFNNEKSIIDNNDSNFSFDYTSSKYVKNCIKNKIEPSFKDDYIYIGAHNYNSKIPIIHPKYFMLGGTAPSRLMLFELNSMFACAVKRNKTRLYKYNFRICE